MALTLFTGVPGMGKTALIVDKLIDEAAKGRKIFVSGIPGLQVMHEVAGDVTEWHLGTWLKINHYDPMHVSQEGWRPRDDGQPASDCGALLVVDECQRYFRNRPAGSKVPDFVQALEVHRKQGLDIWLISQRPGQVDSHVRGLCEKHFGIWHNWLGRYLYEWSTVSNIDSKSERDLAKKSRYKIPKRAFDWYKSAEVISSPPKHSAPMLAKFGILLLLGLGFTGYKSYQTFHEKFEPTQAQTLPTSPAKPGQQANGDARSAAQVADAAPLGGSAADAYVSQFTPVVPGRPETAPAFSGLRQVAAMPWPSACLKMSSRCICYSSQGTKLPEVSAERCQQILEQGGIFDPYRVPEGQQPAPVNRSPILGA